ncbi:TPA: cation:proton antiporter [Candidatus Micrarchaeota archaeon]|nr:cation:proton antiporter [Candidatus Micrarchaeota archaeon]
MEELKKRVYPFAVISVFLLFIVLVLSIFRTTIFGGSAEVVSEEKYMFFEITLLLLLAILADLVFTHFKQPSVMILLILGILMSKGVLGFDIIRDEKLISIFAQLGAIFLLFKVGLHSHLTKVFSRENLIVAILGIIVPFVSGYLYASATGGSFIYSMFLAAALTATSVGVTVAILREAGMLQKKFAEVIIGAAVIDDILGLLVLVFITNIPAGAIALSSILPLAKVAGLAAVFLFGGVVFGRAFVRIILDTDEKTLDNRAFLLALSLLFIYAYVAEYIGLSSIVGAFLAGVMLNYSRHSNEITEKIYSLEAIFVPVFFISLGMLVDIGSILLFLVPIAIISVIAIISKVVGCGIGAFLSRLSTYDAALIGVGMTPRGEVALIIALIGLSKGVLTGPEYSIISAMALVTTIITPPVLSFMLKRVNQY